ncbi:MAG: sensor histidine kinase [Mycobacteriaceae bacterium]
MSTLSGLLAEHTGIAGTTADHLQQVVGEWQLLADLSFADFRLWVPVADELLCVAQVRPTTAHTSYAGDAVGPVMSRAERPQLGEAMAGGRVLVEGRPYLYEGLSLRRESVPVMCRGQVVAVLSRDTNLATVRRPSPLEAAYLDSAAVLCQMIAEGSFPASDSVADVHTSPRAGDGFIRLDPAGAVLYASPNAHSAYRRMGLPAELVGTNLAKVTRTLISDPFDASEVVQRITAALAGSSTVRIEADARGATVLLRALPLRPQGMSRGALVLVRDVTEVRNRDRALLSKDATIREIHHRVKNNLQTVAALLRLQARRSGNEEVRTALSESVRRVASIALVHDTLSMSVDERVDLDDVIDRLVPMMVDVATVDNRVRVRREGAMGELSAELAMPLVMVLAELVQNALEHAFVPGASGSVVVRAERSAGWLDVVVHDDGVGLPAGFTLEGAGGLGLEIVRTLVDAELGGSLSVHPADDGGTDAQLRLPVTHQYR